MSTPTVPSNLVAGDTWSFTFTDQDHIAPTWDATVYFESAAKSFSAASADSGSDHSFTIAASTTAGYPAGRYKWFIRVNDGSTVATVEQGWMDVQPNPGGANVRDHRSKARQMLDAVEAFLIGNATTAQKAMAINGRSIDRHTLPELREWRNELRNEVRNEERGANSGLGRNIKVRLLRG